MSSYLMYGAHACLAALANPIRKLGRIYISQNYARQYNIAQPHTLLPHKQFMQLSPSDCVCQGIMMEVDRLPIHGLHTLNARKAVILDQITDPHNVGAIIRSAVAFGFCDLITTYDNTFEEGATLAKSASGALEQVRIYRVTNLASAMAELKTMGFWIAGLALDTSCVLDSYKPADKVVIALGSEGRGLRRLTAKNCDDLLRIPMNNIQSLNVSNAAAIAFYEVSKKLC